MKKKYFLFLFISFSCLAQFSKIHYLPPLSSSDNFSASAQEQYIYISTPNIAPVNFKITELGGAIITGTVSKSTPYIYNVGFGTDTQLMLPRSSVNTIVSNKGYVIEGEDLIYVSARVIAGSGNQAGAVVSKGLAALGTQFRIGALLNVDANQYTDNHYTFVSILATENNTLVHFSDIRPGVQLLNNSSVGNVPNDITLNSGESFVMAVEGPAGPNRDGLIGSLVSSDKPIAVNCGSFCGTNATTNLDTGFDQIVSEERTGKEYIFIKSTGQAPVERVLLIAHQDNTEIYLNGSTIIDYTLNAGQYLALDGDQFSPQGNLYVQTNKNIFAYQTIGDNSRTDFANQELFFVPPLSCETPHVIDNIPQVTSIGNRTFTIARITLITKTASTVNIEVNGVVYLISALASLPGVNVTGPIAVTGTADYETYIITGLSGNIAAFSTSQLYLAAYGTDGAATFGGFYSGFTFKPEIAFDLVDITQNNCIPNTNLSVNSLSPFDVFQWYFNDVAISGAIANSYNPTQPGYYHVKATIADCGTTLVSDNIPISACPSNMDNDLSNDNIDLDDDNDGITNCSESYGNQNIDLSNSAILNLITAGTATASPTPFTGTTTGDFITETAVGKNNSVSFLKTFAQPTSISFEYVATANATDLLDANSEFVINSDINKTMTVLNPNNQLLIDTNFDGIFESGITEFSSFEIRFRLNGGTPLAAGTGTFQIKSYLLSSFTYKQINLSDAIAAKATFKLIATCVPKDFDLDGIYDYLDSDSDNDGIPDNIEALGQNFTAFSNVDLNHDGLDDAYNLTAIPVDSDSDSIPDYLDLDSDNDGIYDLIESSGTAPDLNLDGIIDGVSSAFGTNGLFDALETTADAGIVNYSVADTDSDGINNYIENDSDDDGCFDTLEAGFPDTNNDGVLGNTTTVINANGIVTNAIGYLALPNQNYIIAAPIVISSQPSNQTVCELQNASFTVATNPVTAYQWQVSTDDVNWTNLTNNSTYSGTTTSTLQIATALPLNGKFYHVVLSKTGNSCGLTSISAILNVLPIPTVISSTTLMQCDDDTDGISSFNLTAKNSFISSNYINETFTYFTTAIGASTDNTADLIPNPTAYTSTTGTVWVRISNADNCFATSRLDLVVSITQLSPAFLRTFTFCDDYIDAANDDYDGIATFDFSSVTADINAALPPPSSLYTIKYFKSNSDALAEINAISNISNYRNVGFANQESIWVRIDSNIDNACFGLGPHVLLTVESLPIAHPIADFKECDDNNDGTFTFNTAMVQSDLLQGQTNVSVTYFDQNNLPLPSPFPPNFTTVSQTITARVTNNTTSTNNGQPCYDETTIKFIIDARPILNAVTIQAACDDNNPSDIDGINSFDTSATESTLLNGLTGMSVTYSDANGNPLPSPLPNPFVTDSKIVTVNVVNPLNTTCPASSTLNFVVNPLPNIELAGNELVCINRQDFFTPLDAGINDGTSPNNYTYIWTKDGVSLPETSPTININSEGIYTVQVISAFGCSRIRTITVLNSDIAHIDSIQIVDLTDINTVQVFASGTGDYVYSLDFDANYQTSPFFENVAAGVHHLYIKDLNGCGIIGPIEISVLGAPHFFSPNQDNFNDSWNIIGVTKNFNKNANIIIYDRYGKLITQLAPLGPGWNGTFNGKPLPADDYWFTITLDNNRIAKGHFALIR